MSLGLVGFRIRIRVRVSIGVSLGGSFRVRVKFWLAPSTQLDLFLLSSFPSSLPPSFLLFFVSFFPCLLPLSFAS